MEEYCLEFYLENQSAHCKCWYLLDFVLIMFIIFQMYLWNLRHYYSQQENFSNSRWLRQLHSSKLKVDYIIIRCMGNVREGMFCVFRTCNVSREVVGSLRLLWFRTWWVDIENFAEMTPVVVTDGWSRFVQEVIRHRARLAIKICKSFHKM